MADLVNIAVINESTVVTDADVQNMMPAWQIQWSRDLRSFWPDVPEAKLVWMSKGQQPPDDYWWFTMLDDSDQADALAYHDKTDKGLPIAKVFARTILNDGSILSVSGSHELLEMGVDPNLDKVFVTEDGTEWAGEIADPPEDDSYSYFIGNTSVSNFVGSGWFGEKGPLDYCGYITKPFQVLSRGYAQKFDKETQEWVQIDGSRLYTLPETHHARSAAKGSRRERRVRHPNLRNSERWARNGGGKV